MNVCDTIKRLTSENEMSFFETKELLRMLDAYSKEVSTPIGRYVTVAHEKFPDIPFVSVYIVTGFNKAVFELELVKGLSFNDNKSKPGETKMVLPAYKYSRLLYSRFSLDIVHAIQGERLIS